MTCRTLEACGSGQILCFAVRHISRVLLLLLKLYRRASFHHLQKFRGLACESET